MTRLTNNFTLEEMCASATAKARGIDNTPPSQIIANLTHLCCHVLQPLRDHFRVSVPINSGYRCPKLNAVVGGVANSQHMMGEAADINIGGDIEKGKRWFTWIRCSLQFDQLIWEHNAQGVYWIHVSYRESGNRNQVIDNLLKK